MRLLFLTVLLNLTFISCGTQTLEVEVDDAKYTVDGEATIVIDWNLDAFEIAFKAECEAITENLEDSEACIINKLSDLLKMLNNGVEEIDL